MLGTYAQIDEFSEFLPEEVLDFICQYIQLKKKGRFNNFDLTEEVESTKRKLIETGVINDRGERIKRPRDTTGLDIKLLAHYNRIIITPIKKVRTAVFEVMSSDQEEL